MRRARVTGRAGKDGPAPAIVVRALSHRATRGHVAIGPLRLPCALGRGGRRAIKREGDGATPIGVWPLREVRYRADQVIRPATPLPLRPLRVNDGWCDAPADRNYNRAVRHPYAASAERMWRPDRIYDLVLVLGYNDMPRRRGRGSAIFLHLAREKYTPTEGCIALSLRDTQQLLARVRPASRLIVPG